MPTIIMVGGGQEVNARSVCVGLVRRKPDSLSANIHNYLTKLHVQRYHDQDVQLSKPFNAPGAGGVGTLNLTRIPGSLVVRACDVDILTAMKLTEARSLHSRACVLLYVVCQWYLLSSCCFGLCWLSLSRHVDFT